MKRRKKSSLPRIIGLGMVALVAGGLLFLWTFTMTDSAGEPWFLLDGISAIPTIIIRWEIIIYAIAMCIFAQGRFKQSHLNLTDRFGLERAMENCTLGFSDSVFIIN